MVGRLSGSNQSEIIRFGQELVRPLTEVSECEEMQELLLSVRSPAGPAEDH